MHSAGRAQCRASTAATHGADSGDHPATTLMIKAKKGGGSGGWPRSGKGTQPANERLLWALACATLAVALLVVLYMFTGHAHRTTDEPAPTAAVAAALAALARAQQPPAAPQPMDAAAAAQPPPPQLAGAGAPQASADAAARPLPRSRHCIGWRATASCSPFGTREPNLDLGCDELVPQIQPGYCHCEGGVTTARSTCRSKPKFTCRGKCAELGLGESEEMALPEPIGCPYNASYRAEDVLQGVAKEPPGWRFNEAKEGSKVAKVWYSVYKLVHKHGISEVKAPGVRDGSHDFVKEGVKIPKKTVKFVRSQLAAYRQALPKYPEGAYLGRGVVTVGGGLNYMVPVWLLVHRLRFSGCTLPIEVWFPVSDWPTIDAIKAFEKMGATPRKFEYAGLNIYLGDGPDKHVRFTFKVAAMTLSRFQEVLYLDADNIPLKDPSFLFSSPPYRATGALFWQDYWRNTVAPQAARMLGISRNDSSQWFPGSFESGQMVVDKKRHWRGMLVAVWMNIYSHFWYEILTCHLGKGDKETFAYGMAAAGERYSVIQTPPGSVGLQGTTTQCNRDNNRCKFSFTGNSMLQFDTEEIPLFLHANINKLGMRLPNDFKKHYIRRWQVFYPGRQDWQKWSVDHLGYDLEFQIYQWIRMLRCTSWWDDYVEERFMRGDKHQPYLEDSFHNMINGIDFSAFYNGGWYGVYTKIFTSFDIARWTIGSRRLLGSARH